MAFFRDLCKGKSEKFQRELRILDRWEATSQHCSKCGWHWGKLDLSTRMVVCDNCNAVHCRDENAAKCIEQVGMGHRPTLKRTWRPSKTTEPKGSVASVVKRQESTPLFSNAVKTFLLGVRHQQALSLLQVYGSEQWEEARRNYAVSVTNCC
jgi:transposase